MRYEKLYQAVEKHKNMILEAERHIWKNPEPGYREWKTHAYLKEKYEALGYKLVEAKTTRYGFMRFKYVKVGEGEAGASPPSNRKRPLKC